MPAGDTFEHRWHRLISGDSRGPLPSLARVGLTALSGLYWLGLNGNHALYNLRLRRQTRSALPVISLGNLSVGGTGKSVAVRYIARELVSRGLRPGIVLRGHRREDASQAILASDGQGTIASLALTGDEAAEHLRALPEVPVAVGKRREQAIELLAAAGVQVAILDDGFQYFRMARNWDIVLISARLDLRTARLLPRGILREPWSHLRRADQVWITHADEVTADQLAAVQAAVARVVPHQTPILARHASAGIATLQGADVPLESLRNLPVIAMSGLGSPGSFESSLAALGAQVTPLRYADHHHYQPADWLQVRETAERAGATVVVTTEKDAVKLPEGAPLPVWVLRTQLQIMAGKEQVLAGLEQFPGDTEPEA
ncbi:MAG: tetraacyldisaccharide 4'-kinase [Armatimonadia bacterium]